MPLRMHLFGCRLERVRAALGRGDAELLATGMAQLEAAYGGHGIPPPAATWLRTLLTSGPPEPPAPDPDDGGLLVVRLETEHHATAACVLARTCSGPDCLDFTLESSERLDSEVAGLCEEMQACLFTRSIWCPPVLLRGMTALSVGTPLFGDDFRSDGALYTIFPHAELADLAAALQAAVDYRRVVPERVPAALLKSMKTELSPAAKSFAAELAEWFSRLRLAEQDAFVMWL